MRPPFDHGGYERLDELVIGGAANALVSPADIDRIREAIRIVRSDVEQDRQRAGRIEAAASGIERQFADRNAHPFPEFVLLDLKMPLMSGFELLRWIRAQPVIKRLPVIVFSSSLHEGDAALAYEEGANSFVGKPTDFRKLVQMMKSLGEFWLGASKFPEANPESV